MSMRELLSRPGMVDRIHAKIGMSRSGLFNIKNGKANPTMKTFKKICEAAEVDPGEVAAATFAEME